LTKPGQALSQPEHLQPTDKARASKAHHGYFPGGLANLNFNRAKSKVLPESTQRRCPSAKPENRMSRVVCARKNDGTCTACYSKACDGLATATRTSLYLPNPEIQKLLFLRVGPRFRLFLGSKRPSSSSKTISASGGRSPPPALMGFEEEENRRSPGPTLKNNWFLDLWEEEAASGPSAGCSSSNVRRMMTPTPSCPMS
jgi:hypothetical protein